MISHEIDYKIIGDDIQFVEIELDPNETVIAEAGTMVYMEQGITFEARMGDGASAEQGVMGKLFQAGSRVLTGESLFLTHFTNRGSAKSKVAFAAPYPGTIIPVDLREVRNSLIVQKDGFLCAAYRHKTDCHPEQEDRVGDTRWRRIHPPEAGRRRESFHSCRRYSDRETAEQRDPAHRHRLCRSL